MFYRLWEAAKRRPTRTLMIVGAVIMLAAFAHAWAIYWAFMAWTEPAQTPTLAASQIVTALSYARIGLAMDWAGLGVALITLAWAGWRMHRRLP